MRISAKLSDFINSKYHKETLDFLSGILLSDLHKECWDYNIVTNIVTPFSYLVSRGRTELYNFTRKGLGLTGNVIIDFEDFSINVVGIVDQYSSQLPEGETFYVFMSVRRVWLPRKKPIVLRYYEELVCHDGKFFCYYKFSKILLPKNRRDVYKFLTWLRLKKQILFPPEKKKWCRGYWHSCDYFKILPTDVYVRGIEISLDPEIMMEFLNWQNNRYKITK
jgi:hypothetical protein